MPVLIFSSKVIASKNIAEQLISMGFEGGNDEWERKGVKLIDCKSESILGIPTDFDTDYILVLSSHKMKKPVPMLTVHMPGNWDKADFGGETRTLNIAYASKIKQLLLEIEQANNIGWEVTMESDHHGPTCNVPLMYVEIGSSENEWKNKDAAKAMATGISKAIDRDKRCPAFFGVGGGHYARSFWQIAKGSSYAAGHIIPKHYLASLKADTFEQAIKKNVDPVEKVLVLKEETSAKDRAKVKQLCNEFNVEYNEVGKQLNWPETKENK